MRPVFRWTVHTRTAHWPKINYCCINHISSKWALISHHKQEVRTGVPFQECVLFALHLIWITTCKLTATYIGQFCGPVLPTDSNETGFPVDCAYSYSTLTGSLSPSYALLGVPFGTYRITFHRVREYYYMIQILIISILWEGWSTEFVYNFVCYIFHCQKCHCMRAKPTRRYSLSSLHYSIMLTES